MLTLLSCLILHVSQSAEAQQKLALADQMYSLAADFPRQMAGDPVSGALSNYVDVLQKFGATKAAQVGEARCYLKLGEFAKAVDGFAVAGMKDSPEARDATTRAKLAHVLQGALHLSVLQLEPVPGTSRWIACLGQRVAPKDDPNAFSDKPQRLALVDWKEGSATAKPISTLSLRGTLSPKASYAEYDQTLRCFVVPGDSAKKHWLALICHQFPTGDPGAPTELEAITIGAGGLKRQAWFTSDEGIDAVSATQGYGLIVQPTSMFPVFWQDAYEWRGGKFVFANHQHPELYGREDNHVLHISGSDTATSTNPGRLQAQGGEPYGPASYGSLMERGSIADIKGDFVTGLSDWKAAERLCLAKLRYGKKNGKADQYFDDDTYGPAKLNLSLIRQRISLLYKGDRGSPLLYRPFGFDLQVAPFKLGAKNFPEKRRVPMR